MFWKKMAVIDMKWSDDWQMPYHGLFSKAMEYDKWTHFGGSAACVVVLYLSQRFVMVIIDLVCVVMSAKTFSEIGAFDPECVRIMVLIDFVVVNIGGIVLEWIQSIRYNPETKTPDGFSIMDAVANFAGSATASLAIIV